MIEMELAIEQAGCRTREVEGLGALVGESLVMAGGWGRGISAVMCGRAYRVRSTPYDTCTYVLGTCSEYLVLT
jgi:hypothetical protein